MNLKALLNQPRPLSIILALIGLSLFVAFAFIVTYMPRDTIIVSFRYEWDPYLDYLHLVATVFLSTGLGALAMWHELNKEKTE